ncbi:ribose-5-phosphate isomerase RpiA [Gammaproteobacteria bacterium]|jgi:ribose 5-phosphate isomerase A|nr:ribose-5-phosphate isomerase RpiA [Gammaproteobacteria bacterium]MDB2534870.1 ribose-5-phosphate isomerase RpiA [Gammaproteobacteria bacterium]|tara:strand:+ start:1059 stop:1697 length:639 start_codon:yes stop_codon:yes gene_type:complete
MSSSKINVAKQAINYIKDKLHPDMVLGIGTGSTVNFFIEELGEYKNLFSGAVSSSDASSILLNEKGIEVFNLNDVMDIAFYIDGADEVSPSNCLIKGGGGAHTREKIVASASNEFVCIVDDSKLVSELGDFPLPVEVIPESRSLVARKIVSMGGTPIYRSGFVTDQGNHILDVKDLNISNPEAVEALLNNIPGVVDNGIFAFNKPKTVLVSE